jgi:hypothetical protein
MTARPVLAAPERVETTVVFHLLVILIVSNVEAWYDVLQQNLQRKRKRLPEGSRWIVVYSTTSCIMG